MKKIFVVQLLGAFLLLFIFSGCYGKRQLTVQEIKMENLVCVAVIPAETPVNQGGDISFEQARILNQGATQVDAILLEKLRSAGRFRFVDAGQAQSIPAISASGRLNQLKSIAKKLSCNAVLTTQVSRYRQRVGTALSVDSAASALIQMQLLSVVDGRVLWKGVFNETQQPFLSNLLSLDKASMRGFQWITVEELTRGGVEELLAQCPYFK